MSETISKINKEENPQANKPWVSILVPVYKVENYIERCTRSVFEQTYPNIEYIFVDDCTPDRSIEVLERVMKDYPERAKHVKIVHFEKNKGVAVVRNTLVTHCQTDWLMFLDSDDSLEISIIEKMIAFQQQTQADIITSDFLEQFHDIEKPISAFESDSKEEFILDVIRFTESHYLWGKLIRTSLFRDNDVLTLEGINIGEDWQMVVKLFYYANKICPLHEQSVFYTRSRVGSLTYYTQDVEEAHFRKYSSDVIKSLHEIESFLSDKNPAYMKELQKTIFDRLTYYMAFSAMCGFKDYHKELTKASNLIVKQNPYVLEGKTETLKYYLKTNYFVYRRFLAHVS